MPQVNFEKMSPKKKIERQPLTPLPVREIENITLATLHADLTTMFNQVSAMQNMVSFSTIVKNERFKQMGGLMEKDRRNNENLITELNQKVDKLNANLAEIQKTLAQKKAVIEQSFNTPPADRQQSDSSRDDRSIIRDPHHSGETSVQGLGLTTLGSIRDSHYMNSLGLPKANASTLNAFSLNEYRDRLNTDHTSRRYSEHSFGSTAETSTGYPEPSKPQTLARARPKGMIISPEPSRPRTLAQSMPKGMILKLQREQLQKEHHQIISPEPSRPRTLAQSMPKGMILKQRREQLQKEQEMILKLQKEQEMILKLQKEQEMILKLQKEHHQEI